MRLHKALRRARRRLSGCCSRTSDWLRVYLCCGRPRHPPQGQPTKRRSSEAAPLLPPPPAAAAETPPPAAALQTPPRASLNSSGRSEAIATPALSRRSRRSSGSSLTRSITTTSSRHDSGTGTAAAVAAVAAPAPAAIVAVAASTSSRQSAQSQPSQPRPRLGSGMELLAQVAVAPTDPRPDANPSAVNAAQQGPLQAATTIEPHAEQLQQQQHPLESGDTVAHTAGGAGHHRRAVTADVPSLAAIRRERSTSLDSDELQGNSSRRRSSGHSSERSPGQRRARRRLANDPSSRVFAVLTGRSNKEATKAAAATGARRRRRQSHQS